MILCPRFLSSRSLWAFAAFLLLAQPRPGLGQDCSLRVLGSTLFVGDSIRFQVTCPNPAGVEVAWEYGDDTPLTDYSPSLTSGHVYGQAGFYNVFARFKGQDIPAATNIIVVRRPTAAAPTHSSTILFDAPRRRVWVVNPDNHSVSAVDAVTRQLLFEAAAGRNPRTLALGPDGNIWVTAQDDASVNILDGKDGHLIARVKLPFASRPYGIAFDPAGKNAYVSLEATGRLVRIDAVSRAVNGTAALGPTPRGLAISHDGSRILVTRHISRMSKAGAADYGEVWEVDGGTFALKRTIKLDMDTATDRKDNSRGVPTGISSITITPDGSQALVPCIKDNTQKGMALDGLKPTFETSVRTIIARIDLVTNREDMATRSDVDNRSISSSVAFDKLGRFAYLTTHGTNKTLILQASTLRGFSALGNPTNPAEYILKGEARELAPIGSVLDDRDSLLFVHYFMSREVGIYDATLAGRSDSITTLALVKTVAKDSLPLPVLIGKQIFHNGSDPRMGKEGYISCAACHLDGATDGRVWDFTDRGEGLRRTTTLLGRAGMGQGPVHWSANFDEIQDFEHDMRGPFAGSGFLPDDIFNQGTRNKTLGDKKAGLSPELDAMAAYVASLTTIHPSPFRNADGTMTAEAVKGKALFNREDVGCFKCHSAPNFTDSHLPSPGVPVTPGPVSIFNGAKSYYTAEGFLLHDVGTLKPTSGKRLNDTLKGLDTPTLKGIWENGSFLHDGSAPGAMDVLTNANPADKHGKTSHLTEEERQQLVAFLMQLDDLDELGHTGIRTPGPGQARPLSRLTVRMVPGAVQIGLSLPASAEGVRVTLMDTKGALIRVFAGQAGQKEWRWAWDGSDGAGKRAGAGIYFVRAEAKSAGAIRAIRFAFSGLGQ